ncbi:hypothetical protein AJ79_01157 [Helicocarpus griseus UAMH5409]|uniref:Uncharacterized protein n=1 Tax=Helicocarpus griseus UAMH5409 TaxID=1447875 RepID=A0A2B7XZP2_9EURO|nr:hypothetical protein AJ79_01157 [Helicocarpus griseus UAMH5409]
MVVFVDLEQDASTTAAAGLAYHHHIPNDGHPDAVFLKHSTAVKPKLMKPSPPSSLLSRDHGTLSSSASGSSDADKDGCRADKKSGDAEEEPSPADEENAADGDGTDGYGRTNPNDNGFSAALSCYPVVVQIARSVDLNTLDSLAMTCRQFRVNLLQFRSQLVRETLRCRNEPLDEPPSNNGSDNNTSSGIVANDVPGIFQVFTQPAAVIAGGGHSNAPKLTTGKVGRCARDMVADCQRCLGTVCRNCTVKPVGTPMVKNRFRRLCSTCLAAPLSDHFLPYVPSIHDHHDHHHHPPSPPSMHSFTDSAFDRTPCHCEESFWLCRPCGQTLRADDTTYKRVWTWRTRYSAYLGGGLGTGIGEGCQGVKCGRGERCFAAEEIEVEVDCEVDDWTAEDLEHHNPNANHHYHHHHHPNNHNNHHHGNGIYASGHSDPLLHVVDGHSDEEPGYLRQEIVGVGGVVKQKVKKRVRVGACVQEHEDERDTASYLKREYLGDVRSWCGWCERVVPSTKEREELGI